MVMNYWLVIVCALTTVDCFKQRCGDPQVGGRWRITKGEDAERGSWPWLASLDHADGTHDCGASIIADKWLLTAAHCVTRGLYNPESIHIRLGKHRLDTVESSEQKLQAAQVFSHPGYGHGGVASQPHDIALIKLSEPIRFGKFVRPICLPDKDEKSNVRHNCVVAGWGNTQSYQDKNILQQVRGPIFNSNENDCGLMWGEFFTKDHICFAGPNSNEAEYKGACNGDSGGPLICASERGYTQYGVVTFGFRLYCNAPGWESLFVRVSSYKDWITQIMARNP